MLPKKEASRAQQYLMYCPSNGWQCCCFSYIITKILWFSCILTKGTADLHLLHLIPKEPSRQKRGRERPHWVQRAPWRGISTWDTRKGQKNMKHHLRNNKNKPFFYTHQQHTRRMSSSSPVLWVCAVLDEIPTLNREELSGMLCGAEWRILHILVSTSAFPETLRQFKEQLEFQNILWGMRRQLQFPEGKGIQPPWTHKWNLTILVPPFWITRFHLGQAGNTDPIPNHDPESFSTHPPRAIPEGRKHSQKDWFKVLVHGSNSQKTSSFPNISTERNASSRICKLPFRNGLENCKKIQLGKKTWPPREQHLQPSPGKSQWQEKEVPDIQISCGKGIWEEEIPSQECPSFPSSQPFHQFSSASIYNISFL